MLPRSGRHQTSRLARTRSFCWPSLLAVLVLCLTQPAWAATAVVVGSDPSKTVVKGTLVTPDQIIEGELVIEGDTITCVAASCPDPTGATRITVTNAYIFPGFVDAHNHVAYNILARWTPPKLYQRRSQWQAAQAYKDFKRPYSDLIDKGLFCEMVKYGEVKALLSGVTTIQGTAPNNTCFRTLIRNAENQNQLGLPASHIRTFILDISSFKGSMDWSVTKSFAVHIAEGIRGDAPSKQEFSILKSKGLLANGTAIIHGAAFESTEFQQMAAAGAKLIWSPRSNLVLYGQTTNIPLARQAGIEVSLGVDWNPTGSDHIFAELRTAAEVNEDDFSGAIPDEDWIKMVTVNPARALALEAQVGRLAPGLKADITVLRSQGADPTRSVLQAHLQDVQLVWVGGNLLYGNRAVLDKVKPGQCEALLVHGAQKRVCVKEPHPTAPKVGQTLAEIREVLRSHYPLLAPLTP